MEEVKTGMLMASSWLTCDGRRMFLHHFTVKPSFQRQGYGRMLALESLAYAREKGYPLKLEVSPLNLPALNLYRKLGFELLGDYDVYILK
jgi:ribosomal protein S18 acetylase RimI-like enzyme